MLHCSWVANEAVQIHGNGYVAEYHVERMMRDSKITDIEGTSEIQRRYFEVWFRKENKICKALLISFRRAFFYTFTKINFYVRRFKYWYLRDHKLFRTLSFGQIRQLCTGFKKKSARRNYLFFFIRFAKNFLLKKGIRLLQLMKMETKL
jgi:hypothetical protein